MQDFLLVNVKMKINFIFTEDWTGKAQGLLSLPTRLCYNDMERRETGKICPAHRFFDFF